MVPPANMMKHTPAFLVTLGALMLAPAIANAMPETEPHGSAAGLVGWGFREGAGFGLGVRGGYTLAQNVYIGGTFMWHAGSSSDTLVSEASSNVYYLGVEGGYDFQVHPVIIRPYIGLGPGFGHNSGQICTGGPGINCVSYSDTNTVFAFWFGGTVLYPLNEQWFIGGDFKLTVIDSEVLPTLAFTGGLNF